jgi:hypothetical protein
MMKLGNKHSLPHYSKKNLYHVDVYSYMEGKTEPVKFHQITEGPRVKPTSIDALRQRLKAIKGY